MKICFMAKFLIFMGLVKHISWLVLRLAEWCIWLAPGSGVVSVPISGTLATSTWFASINMNTFKGDMLQSPETYLEAKNCNISSCDIWKGLRELIWLPISPKLTYIFYHTSF